MKIVIPALLVPNSDVQAETEYDGKYIITVYSCVSPHTKQICATRKGIYPDVIGISEEILNDELNEQLRSGFVVSEGKNLKRKLRINEIVESLIQQKLASEV
jgi:hypothetical protein